MKNRFFNPENPLAAVTVTILLVLQITLAFLTREHIVLHIFFTAITMCSAGICWWSFFRLRRAKFTN